MALPARKGIVAAIVSAAILAAVFIPFQKASAYTVDLSLPNADPNAVPMSAVGSKFIVTIDVAAGELISISSIELILDNGKPEMKQVVFDSNGHKTSGDPTLTRGNLKIIIPSPSTQGYGYGYGYASAGTTFSSPYSYAFSADYAFIGGNSYGYTYAVAGANLVSGFVGPGQILIEGKLNTAQMSLGTHTLDVLIDTGAGGNGIDQLVAPQLTFTTVKGPVTPTTSNLTVKTVDLSGDTISGVWTVIRHATNGTVIQTGFTPLTFIGDSGAEYRVSVANYDGRIFQHWEDGSTNRARTINLTTNTTITATFDQGNSLRGFSSLVYGGTEQQPDLTVNAVSLDGSRTLHMWTIIDPQSSDLSNTTYKVYASNYLDRQFDHWEDGSTERIRSLTISTDTTITAYYRTG